MKIGGVWYLRARIIHKWFCYKELQLKKFVHGLQLFTFGRTWPGSEAFPTTRGAGTYPFGTLASMLILNTFELCT
jgi:hypothetical protein